MFRRGKVLLVTVLILVVVASGALGIWRLTQFTPEPVNLEDAIAGVQTTSASNTNRTDSTGTPAAPLATSVEGDWIVETSQGTFDYESATGSFAGFRVEEELLRIGRTTAVGRTGDVSGSLTIEGTVLVSTTITVDLSTITTNDSRRDGAVLRALNTNDYPLATFALTQPVELGDTAISSERPVSYTASGILTLNNVSVPTDFMVEAQTVDEWILVTGTATVTFADFGVTTPSAGIVAQADDFGVVEFQLLFRRA